MTRRPVIALVCVTAALLLPGCLERRIRVTSNPPGARVWLNDREIGRTPAEAAFKYHGDYDVRLEMPGFEPVHAGRRAGAPFHEWPGPDLVAAALPVEFENTIAWHFELEPALERAQTREAFEAGLLDRAEALRADAVAP
jgi:hypothetical protein